MYLKKTGKYSLTLFLSRNDVFVLYDTFTKRNDLKLAGVVNIKNRQQGKNICFIYEQGDEDFRCQNQEKEFIITYSDIEAEYYTYCIDKLTEHESDQFLGLEFKSIIYKGKHYSFDIYSEGVFFL